jgi:hypothetical protein
MIVLSAYSLSNNLETLLTTDVLKMTFGGDVEF